MIVAAPAFLFVNILCSPTVVPSANDIATGVAEFARINPLEVSAAPEDVISTDAYDPFSIDTEPNPLPLRFRFISVPPPCALKFGLEPAAAGLNFCDQI